MSSSKLAKASPARHAPNITWNFLHCIKFEYIPIISHSTGSHASSLLSNVPYESYLNKPSKGLYRLDDLKGDSRNLALLSTWSSRYFICFLQLMTHTLRRTHWLAHTLLLTQRQLFANAPRYFRWHSPVHSYARNVEQRHFCMQHTC